MPPVICRLALLFLIISALPAAHAVGDPDGPGVHRSFALMHPEGRGTAAFTPAPDGYTIQPLARPAGGSGLKKEVFGYLPYWFRSRWNQVDMQLVSTIAYFSGEVAANGTVGDTHGWPKYPGDPSASADVVNMINAAHAAGVRVVLCFTNFEAAGIDAIITTPAYRTTFIQQALSIVQAGGGDGININFEGINSANKAALTAFMIALADSFHTRMPGSQVSCAPTDYDTRAGDWELAALNDAVDLFFFQGYGYGWSGTSVAKPVGLLPNTSFWGSLNITTLIDFVLARIPPAKVVLGVPHYGYRWPTVSGDLRAATTGTEGAVIYYPDALGYTAAHGRLWDQAALNAWFRYQAGTQWYQGWYDDPESMSHKYQFVLDRNLMGIGMWALGMDAGNRDIWNVLASYMSDSGSVPGLPNAPVLGVVKDTSEGFDSRIVVRWQRTGTIAPGGFRLFLTQDPAAWPATPHLDESTLGPAVRSAVISGLTADATYYVRMVAADSLHIRFSDTSDTYTVRTGGTMRYLIVDGFDRTTGSWTLPRHEFSARYGEALAAGGAVFDAADNDAVANGTVDLAAYHGVLWFLGDESVADITLTAVEQAKIRTYLEQGGRLCITGSEIGYDLGRSASVNYAPAFYGGYLKAAYAGDDAAALTYSGSASSAFNGISGTFGQVYPEDYPDHLTPAGGSIAALSYPTSQIAGVQFAGTFGTGAVHGKLVYIAFAVETIGSAAERAALVARVIGFFGGATATGEDALLPDAWMLGQNYPNPFNPSTNITYAIPRSAFVSLKVYDLLGREVRELAGGVRAAGMYTVSFNATGLPSGMYLCAMHAHPVASGDGDAGDSGVFTAVRRMLLVR